MFVNADPVIVGLIVADPPAFAWKYKPELAVALPGLGPFGPDVVGKFVSANVAPDTLAVRLPLSAPTSNCVAALSLNRPPVTVRVPDVLYSCTPSSPTSSPLPVAVTFVSVRLVSALPSMPICLLPVAVTLFSVIFELLLNEMFALQLPGPLLLPATMSPQTVAAARFAVPLPLKFMFFSVTFVALRIS